MKTYLLCKRIVLSCMAAGILVLVPPGAALSQDVEGNVVESLAEISRQRGADYLAGRDRLVEAAADPGVRERLSAVAADEGLPPLTRLLARRIVGRAEDPEADRAFWANMKTVVERLQGLFWDPERVRTSEDMFLHGMTPGGVLAAGDGSPRAHRDAVDALREQDHSLFAEALLWHDRETLLAALQLEPDADDGPADADVENDANADADADREEPPRSVGTARFTAAVYLVLRAEPESVVVIDEWRRRHLGDERIENLAAISLEWLAGTRRGRAGTLRPVHPEARVAAEIALAEITGDYLLTRLQERSWGDPDPAVRVAARKAIEQLLQREKAALAQKVDGDVVAFLETLDQHRGALYLIGRDLLVEAAGDPGVRERLAAVAADEEFAPRIRLLAKRVIGRAENPGADRAFWADLKTVARFIRSLHEGLPQTRVHGIDWGLMTSESGLVYLRPDARLPWSLQRRMNEPGFRGKVEAGRTAVSAILKQDDISLLAEAIFWHDLESLSAQLGQEPDERRVGNREFQMMARIATLYVPKLISWRAEPLSVTILRESLERDGAVAPTSVSLPRGWSDEHKSYASISSLWRLTGAAWLIREEPPEWSPPEPGVRAAAVRAVADYVVVPYDIYRLARLHEQDPAPEVRETAGNALDAARRREKPDP